MGRGGKQAQQTWGEERPYRIWHGAYSPSAQRPHAPWKTGQSAVFPAYNAIDLTKDVPTGHSAGEADTAGAATASGLVPTLQAALNTARKAEQRVMKLKQARSTGATKWQQYEASLKAAFARERTRFTKDQERLAKEITEAEALQEAARESLRAAFTPGQDHVPEVEMADLPSVDQVFAGWAQEERTDYGAVLQRAMEIGPGLATTPLRPTAAAGPGFRISRLHDISRPGGDRSIHPGGVSAGYSASGFLAHDGARRCGLLPWSGHADLTDDQCSTGLRELSCASALGSRDGRGGGGYLGSGAEEPSDGAGPAYGPSPTIGDKLNRRRALEPFRGGRQEQLIKPDAEVPAPEPGIEDDTGEEDESGLGGTDSMPGDLS
eukprot:s896_g6.t1